MNNENNQKPYEPQELDTDKAVRNEASSGGGTGSPDGGDGTNSKLMWGIAALIIAVVAAGAAWMVFGGNFNLGPGSGTNTSSNGDAVAIVNGEEIPREEYDQRVAQQGIDTQDGEVPQQVKDQIMTSLVAEQLVLQEAARENFSANEEDIDAQLSQARSQFSDEQAFADALESQGFTEESFRTFVVQQVTIQNYLATQIDTSAITVTDQEIQDFYDQSFSDAADAPALADVETQIESQIQSQKQQQLVAQYIQSLRAEAEIEILI